PCSKAQAGCVATALAQIMRFYNFPARGSGSHSYKHSSFGILNADFENTVYNWSQMPDALSAPNPYVSQLIAHIGKASDMNYSPTYSGAYSEKAINALFHYFHYSDKLRLLYRDGIADSNWLGMMKNELLAGRPFYYVGYQNATGQNGHAFVCDGFQDDDYFHFNFGWNGSYDGYYLVNNITPYVSYNYIQSAMFGIEPEQYRDCNGLNIYDALESNISDGSLDQPYSNNSDCYWLLGNDNTASVYIRFYTFNTEQDKDLLYVYDGTDTTAKLLGVFSGNKLPPTLKSENGKMLLRFKTDDTISKAGWSAYYKMSFCKNLQVLTAFSDTISDCSGEYNYNNESNCKWLINPENSKSINIKFLEFDTEKDWDFLYIYNGKDTLAPLIAKFSGIELPADINIESDVVLLHFISDYALNSKGWKITYSACPEKPLLNKAGSVYFCKQDTVILNANPGFSSYRWYKNDTLILNSEKNEIIVSDTGFYSVSVNKNSDCFVSSALVSFFHFPEPSFDLGKDTIICINHKILLKAPPGFKSYLWSTGNSADSLLIDYSFVDKDSLVMLSLEVKDTNGCRFNDSINIYFDDCVGLNRNSKDFPRLVYNNNQIIVISENKLPAFSLIFYNIQGQRLYKKDFLPATNEISINIDIRFKGLYFVIFNSDKLKLRKKILIY
nr:C10 family peptidase [Bacteroidales bacterium]